MVKLIFRLIFGNKNEYCYFMRNRYCSLCFFMFIIRGEYFRGGRV